MDGDDEALLEQRVAELTGRRLTGPLRIQSDTTEYGRIDAGDVLRLAGRTYFVLGNATEGRFGIDDQPKIWVKRAVDLESAEDTILKLVFFEEFPLSLGRVRMRCWRSPAKESMTLELMRGNAAFMQGRTVLDNASNPVRVIQFIRGPTLYSALRDLRMEHARYFEDVFPGVFRSMVEAFRALLDLEREGLMHGDIRNDHLVVERESGRLRWIDFDLEVNYSDFDLWSLGNILAFVVGQGILTFHEVLRNERIPLAVRESLEARDGSVFFPYRVMNLRKIFPYLPVKLAEALDHFSVGGDITRFYRGLPDLLDHLDAIAAELPAAKVALLDAR